MFSRCTFHRIGCFHSVKCFRWRKTVNSMNGHFSARGLWPFFSRCNGLFLSRKKTGSKLGQMTQPYLPLALALPGLSLVFFFVKNGRSLNLHNILVRDRNGYTYQAKCSFYLGPGWLATRNLLPINQGLLLRVPMTGVKDLQFMKVYVGYWRSGAAGLKLDKVISGLSKSILISTLQPTKLTNSGSPSKCQMHME